MKRTASKDQLTSKQPPRMYGLPKIHKPGTPLRPIVLCVSSFAYNLSKHLAGILSPLTGNTPNTVPNSTAFAEFLRGQHIGSHEALVSFDVVSLFTSVPIDDACCVVVAWRKTLSCLTGHRSPLPRSSPC